MSKDNNNDNRIELDKIDLSHIKKKLEESARTNAAKKGKTAPEASPKQKPAPQSPSPQKPIPKTKKRNFFSKHKPLIISLLSVTSLLILLVIFFPSLFFPQAKHSIYINNIEKSAKNLSRALVNLNQVRSSRLEKGNTNESIEMVESALNKLSDYNKQVGIFSIYIKDNQDKLSKKERYLTLEAHEFYNTRYHREYINKIKESLHSFDNLIKYRMKYYNEIVNGEQLQRLTYERYILKYKQAVKQLRVKYMFLKSRVRSKMGRSGKLSTLLEYYHLPIWAGLDDQLELME